MLLIGHDTVVAGHSYTVEGQDAEQVTVGETAGLRLPLRVRR